MRKFILAFILFIGCFLFSNNTVLAENFYIDNYNVKMKVSEDRVVNITEEIDVFFTNPSHGIVREIPLTTKIIREKSISITKSKVQNIRIFNGKENFVTTRNSKYVDIKIGDASKLIRGPHKYIIQYDYCFGDTSTKTNDEFYFNIIGPQWPVNINNSSFSVIMPKKVKFEDIGFSIGQFGTVGFKGDAEYSSNGLEIIGHTKRILNPYEGITIRITLPKNYFHSSKAEQNDEKNLFIAIAGILILTFISWAMWYVYGKDEPVIPVVNFYPPENKNSAEIGFEYFGKARTKDVVSLIFYLASKGYLKIDGSNSFFSFTKLKEYDGKNKVEKKLMGAIFSHKKDFVTKKNLEVSTTFYKECEKCIDMLNENKRKLFFENSCSLDKMFVMFSCVLGIFAFVLYSFNNYSFASFFTPESFIFLFPIIFPILINTQIKNKFERIFFTAFSTILPVFAIFQIFELTVNWTVGCIGLAGLIISIICLINMPKRNKRGRLALGNILGFKQFLEVAEKERIQQLLKENPEYCFDILPYAYVLGVEDKWIKNFETIVNQSPKWYGQKFHSEVFNSLVKGMEAVSVPSYSNGGISSSSGGGGGRSGGGHGGGGGHSW